MAQPSSRRFSGKVVLITGAGSGIGRATAEWLAAEGALVSVADIDPRAAGRTAERLGDSAIAVAGDVSAEADVEAMVTATEQQLGPVDVLVNNAAICRADRLTTMTLDEWNLDIAVDLTGPFLCCRKVVPSMVARGGGVIVNVASVNGLAWFKFESYSAAKAGLISLTRSIAGRYGKAGIRANAVAPGTIRTEAWDRVVESQPDALERIAEFYPLARVGEPTDIAAAIAFLASEEASWITGTVLTVDGGLMTTNTRMNSEMWATDS